VHRIGTGAKRGCDQPGDAKVRADRGRGADVHRLVGLPHVQCIGVGVAEHATVR